MGGGREGATGFMQKRISENFQGSDRSLRPI